jgi:hypothetical protein
MSKNMNQYFQGQDGGVRMKLILLMDPMSDDSVSKPDSESLSVPSHASFRAAVGNNKNIGTLNQILGRSDAVWRSVTVYDAAEPFHVLHMDPGSNDE